MVPRSHLSVHADGNPYNRFLRHDEEVMVTCRAGSAVVLNQQVFHGNYPNFSASDRRMLAISYRPAWAGPVTEVEPWDQCKLAALPPAARRLFRDPNTRRIDLAVKNRPAHLDRRSTGISPPAGRRRYRTPLQTEVPSRAMLREVSPEGRTPCSALRSSWKAGPSSSLPPT